MKHSMAVVALHLSGRCGVDRSWCGSEWVSGWEKYFQNDFSFFHVSLKETTTATATTWTVFFFPPPGVAPVRDSVPLSPLEPPATPVDTEKQQGSDRGHTDKDKEQQPGRVSTETSNLRPQTPKAEDKVEDDDEDNAPLTISELAYRSIQCDSQPKYLEACCLKTLVAHCCGSNVFIRILLHSLGAWLFIFQYIPSGKLAENSKQILLASRWNIS